MKRKKIVIGTLIAVIALTMVAGVALADKPPGKGNLAPSGPHYNLNLIGKDWSNKESINCEVDIGAGEKPHGKRIFVKLDKNARVKTKINLVPCSEDPQSDCMDFAVIDCDGTDGSATFMLPHPDPENDGITRYRVYIRLRGKPGGDIIMTTCAYDPDIGDNVCSDLQVIEVRETGHGKNAFTNVTKELLYIYAWVWNPNTEQYDYVRLPLFSPELEGYFWDYDNKGVRLTQLRFYEIPDTVPAPGDVPHLTVIDPASGDVDTVIATVEITGVNLDFTGTKKVDFGNDITFDHFSVIDADTLMVYDVDLNGAATGPRGVTVTLADNTKLTIPFIVTTP